ncbi:hypothetical protein OPQ81_002603 [Rhizoctonia solani]|nr:hypothetical protein OPQ81_002603 [Rhizoctonia solani]
MQSVVITVTMMLAAASGPDEEAKLAADYLFAYTAYFIASFVQTHNQQMNALDGFVVFMTATIPMLMLLYMPLVTAMGRSVRAQLKGSSLTPIVGESSENTAETVPQLYETSAIPVEPPPLLKNQDNLQIPETPELDSDKPAQELAPASGGDEGSAPLEPKKISLEILVSSVGRRSP